MVKIDYGRLRQVSGVVSLQEVLLTQAHWQSFTNAAHLQAAPQDMRYVFQLVDATWDCSPSHGLEIQLVYRLVASAKTSGSTDENSLRLFQLECCWDVLFQVPEDFEPSAAELMADFSVANGQLNAFPYVRQWVQDITARAGWPPLVLPTFRIPAKRPARLGARRELAHRHA